LLNADPEALLVAEVDGVVVGSLIAAWDGWRGSFYRLAVSGLPRRCSMRVKDAFVSVGRGG
jgi:predicted MFS family arabinose efflux permease